jgi:hypothetical protein
MPELKFEYSERWTKTDNDESARLLREFLDEHLREIQTRAAYWKGSSTYKTPEQWVQKYQILGINADDKID